MQRDWTIVCRVTPSHDRLPVGYQRRPTRVIMVRVSHANVFKDVSTNRTFRTRLARALGHHPQHRHALDMRRLRKQVKAPQTLHDILLTRLLGAPDNCPHVPRLRVDITTDIHDRACTESQELVDKLGVAALARGVDDDRGVCARKVGDSGKNVRGIAG